MLLNSNSILHLRPLKPLKPWLNMATNIKQRRQWHSLLISHSNIWSTKMIAHALGDHHVVNLRSSKFLRACSTTCYRYITQIRLSNYINCPTQICVKMDTFWSFNAPRWISGKYTQDIPRYPCTLSVSLSSSPKPFLDPLPSPPQSKHGMFPIQVTPVMYGRSVSWLQWKRELAANSELEGSCNKKVALYRTFNLMLIYLYYVLLLVWWSSNAYQLKAKKWGKNMIKLSLKLKPLFSALHSTWRFVAFLSFFWPSNFTLRDLNLCLCDTGLLPGWYHYDNSEH